MKKLIITVALLLVVGWKPLAGQINVDKINTVFGDAGPVTSLHFSLAGKVDNNARLSLSYGGSIADLEKGQAQAPKQLIFSNSDKTLLAFNIRYAYREFTSYAVMEKNGVLSVIPNIGDVAYGLYLLKHPGQKGESTVVEKIKDNTIYFIHLNAQNRDDAWIYFSGRFDAQGNLVIPE